jgi:23S rRNA (adenine-N6)-dimethyltransferase
MTWSRIMPAYGRSSVPDHSGVHFLAAPRVIGELVRSCRIGTGDLVLDLGAITAPLAGTGANVRVRTGDIRTIPLPGKDFYVVSSIPYAASTALFRRLLGPSRSALRRAAIVVEWGFAKRVTAAVPRDAELAWWAARFEIRLGKRIPA